MRRIIVIFLSILLLASTAVAEGGANAGNGVDGDNDHATDATDSAATTTASTACCETENEKADDEEKEPDDDSFPLLRRGIVLGAGVGIHTPGLKLGDGRPELARVATSGVAYLGVHFGYWGDLDETDAFCASYRTKAGLRRAYETAKARTKAVAGEDFELSVKKQRGWLLNVPANCGFWRKFGLFVTLPSDFDADVHYDGGTVSRSVRPLVTVGVIWSQWPYLNILGGVTFSNVAIGSGDDKYDRVAGSLFFGLGTPFDAIGGLFK